MCCAILAHTRRYKDTALSQAHIQYELQPANPHTLHSTHTRNRSPPPLPTMLEYFTYKKVKKHRAQKDAEREAKDEAQRHANEVKDSDDILDERASRQDHDKNAHRHKDKHHRYHGEHQQSSASPVLDPDDESFLEELLAGADGPAPPLPPRTYLAEFDWPSDNEAAASSSEGREEVGEASQPHKKGGADKTAAAEKKPNRLSLLFTRHKKTEQGLEPEKDVSPAEGERETKDLSRVLDRLNLSAKNNKVISSTDSSEVLQKFTQVFKDLVNGVPTAYDDLAKLVEDRDGTLSKGFDKLPSSLKKLVTQLPEKITQSLGPEILAAAAGSQGIKAEAEGGIKGTAKKILLPHNITELVTKPGAIVGMLRAIVEVLKTRWPAFIGMNVIWSVALSCKLKLV